MMSSGLRTELKKRMSTSADTSQSHRDMLMSGVMPLPAARKRIFFGTFPGDRWNFPLGPLISIASPTLTLSGSQFDTSPPGTRLTVTSSTNGRVGVDEIEYERTTFLPSMLSTSEQNWPGRYANRHSGSPWKRNV